MKLSIYAACVVALSTTSLANVAEADGRYDGISTEKRCVVVHLAKGKVMFCSKYA